MNIKDQYCIVAGTVRGVLATTNCNSEQLANFQLGEGENISEITALEWGRMENEVILGNKNGELKLYSILNDKYTRTVKDLQGKGAVVGIGRIENAIVAGRHDGYINIWSKKDNINFSLNLESESSLECIALNKLRTNVIGTGGIKNDFKLWNLETQQCIFKAKSLGHDNLNLPIPTSIRGICYFPSEEKLSGCITREGYVLLYDERTQRRPVSKFIEPKASYSSIAAIYKDRQCVVGTTKGYIQLIDLRAPAKCVRTFKSFTGSVTDIVCDPSKSIVASTSLDRFLRIHNIETKELLYKEYLKQSLTKLVLKPIVKEEPPDENEKNKETIKEEEVNTIEDMDMDKEYEALFSRMETISEEPLKKKRKRLDIKRREK